MERGQICRRCREEGEQNSDEEAEYHGLLSRLRRKIETPRLKFIRAVRGRCLAVKILLMVMGTMIVLSHASPARRARVSDPYAELIS